MTEGISVHWNSQGDARTLPCIVQPAGGSVRLADWAVSQKDLLAERLVTHGAILFRGFDVRGQADFDAFSGVVIAERLDYVYRSTPRSSAGDRVFTATEYPRHATIPLHCENAYQRAWPSKLALYCPEPASRGGETTLADNVRVTERIGRAVVDTFATKQVMYVRNYGPGVDIPWQTVFQTSRREDVEQFCRSHGIDFEWKGEDGLRTRQVCQGVATHPRTGQTVWFNQAHLFHVSSLDAKSRAAMLSVFEEKDLPRNAYFGDGSPIPAQMLDAIRDAYRRELVARPWQRDDVLLLDNMLVAHGRSPFAGQRKVLVVMGDPVGARDAG